MVGTVIIGVGVLLGLAVLLGNVLDSRAQQDAWRRIAEARRRNAEKTRELQELELALLTNADELERRERRVEYRERSLLLREEAIDKWERDLHGDEDGDTDLPDTA